VTDAEIVGLGSGAMMDAPWNSQLQRNRLGKGGGFIIGIELRDPRRKGRAPQFRQHSLT
jgi:hypothetical protein